MEYTTIGKTSLKVSVAGLGCGGFSRLGIPHGKTEDEAARLILDGEAMARGADGRPPRSSTRWRARTSGGTTREARCS